MGEQNEPLIRLENLVKIYDTGAIKVLGLKKINLTIERGEFVAIMGHSGSGKSTLMNILGCLDRPTLGHYFLDGEDTSAMTPDALSDIRNRKIGFVFQSFNLISRTSALKNVELPMTYARIPKARRTARAKELLERVGLGARKEHMPNELSGGQRQRVALARSVCSQSPICLMDEPLSNLDAKLRGQMRNEIRRLQKQLGLTVIYVTHDQVEAMTMGDRIMVLHGGKIQQTGTPLELYNCPANTFVAGFIGSPQMNLCQAKLTEQGLVLENDLVLPLTLEERRNLPQGTQWQIGVRAEQIEPASPAQEGTCLVYAASTEMMGNETQVLFRVGDVLFTARWAGQYMIDPGQRLHIRLSADDFHFFDLDKGSLVRPALHIKGQAALTA